MDTIQLKLYENRIVINAIDFTGSDNQEFLVVSGSRLLVTLQVDSIDPGTQINLTVGNAISRDGPYDGIGSLSATGVGASRQVYTDFHQLFRLSYTVTGGTAKFRVAVALADNAGTTRIENADLDVQLTHTVDSHGHFDSVRIGDGQDLLAINSDGSTNVVFTEAPDELGVFPYAEAAAVANGVETDVLQYTVPADKIAFLFRVETSGENIARYQVLLNGDVIATRRTHHGSGLTTEFDFTTMHKRTVQLQAGDLIQVKVLHSRPFAGNFEARAQLLLKDV